jgi:beta-lactamase regulating signal transducer with metallopeptidase domain
MSGVMLCIWIIVSLFMLFKLFYLYHNSLKEIRTFDANPDYVLQDILTQIVSEKRSHVQPSILISSSINTPMSFGIIKKYILLPDRKYKQQESYYILLHEYTHLVSGDLLVKLLISILYCIYWWNPFVYFLKKDLEQPLEIKCDLLIVKDLDNRHKADYLETIIAGIRDVENKKSKQSKHWSMKGSLNLYQKASVDIKERFYIVSKYSKKDSKISSYIIMLSLFFITLSISYMFIVQPVYDVPIEEIETNANTFEIHTDQLVEDENGSFEIILPNGQSIVVDQETALKMQSLD